MNTERMNTEKMFLTVAMPLYCIWATNELLLKEALSLMLILGCVWLSKWLQVDPRRNSWPLNKTLPLIQHLQ